MGSRACASTISLHLNLNNDGGLLCVRCSFFFLRRRRKTKQNENIKGRIKYFGCFSLWYSIHVVEREILSASFRSERQ